MLPAQVESVTSLCTWLMMVNRGALSILDQTYVWTRVHRESKVPLQMPQEVRRELAALSAVLPLIRQLWSAPWLTKVLMFDASEIGAGICETQGTITELREEARWAVRGGWLTYSGQDDLMEN